MSPTDNAARNIEIVCAYLALVERLDDAEGLARCFHPEGTFEELPNAISPRGSTRGRPALLESFARAGALLASQRYEVLSAFAAADQDRVVVEFLWTGTLKIDAGPLRAGETLRAHCAGVFELRDGQIYRQRQYDCYQPRAAASAEAAPPAPLRDHIVRPEDILPAGAEHAAIGGVEVRKGSVAAFVANAKNLATLEPGTPEHGAVVAQLQALAPLLAAVGVLDIFEPRSPELRRIIASAVAGPAGEAR